MTAVPQQRALAEALGDRYTVERELGSGGMATVYLAQDVKHRRRVAIKVLRPALAASLGADRFVREIEIAAQLSHPHILPLFDSGEADGLLYYMMPYVEGESLRDRLVRAGKLTVAETVKLTDQVSSALAYAHERGVVHRDIKPENIMLAGDQAIVADFGIARAVEAAGGERLTGTGLAVGTPAYMSPEQWSGAAAVDSRTDVYALGCVVYEMVGGHPPFEGTTPQELLAKHSTDPVPHLRTSDPAIPLFVERAVERALAKDPNDRFATVNEFSAALTTGTVVARVRHRGRRRWAAAGAAVTAVVALGVWSLATLATHATVERLAVLPLVDLTNDPEQAYLVEGVHEALIAELGQLGLSVTARATMAQFRDTDQPLPDIASQLRVDGVLEGSVFRDGDSLEITARLYDDGGEQLWAASFDGVLSNVVALYRGFARAIAEKIEWQLTAEDEAALSESRPVNPDVYEAYLRGMHVLHNRTTRAAVDTAIGYFAEAVERNPADPLAYAGLALAYATLGHGFDPPDDAWPRTRAAAERALRLDSTLAEAWAALADYKTYAERDWAGAERAFRRANELNPSLAMNHYHYAWYLVVFGRIEEALAEHRRAQELDPLTPLHTTWLPAVHFGSGQYERALPLARENVERYSPGVIAHYVLGETLSHLGQHEEAIEVHQKLADVFPRWSSALAITYVRAGRSDEARPILAQFEAQPPSAWNAHALARIHTALGNREQALRWMDYEPAHAWMAWVVAREGYDAFHGDPEFEAVMRKMNLRRELGDQFPTALPMTTAPLAGDVKTSVDAVR
jgi:serine/threonine-protein kinase